MDICIGMCRLVVDDSLINESWVDFFKFDYIVLNYNVFMDLVKSFVIFWINIENNVFSRSYNCKYVVFLI